MGKWRTIEGKRSLTVIGTARSWVPSVGGCYAIYADDRLVYVGATEDLQSRIREHASRTFGMTEGRGELRTYDHNGVTFWVPVKRWRIKLRVARYFGEWATLELRLIRRLRPCGNKRSVRPPRRRVA